jgi:hypothetical protein
VVSPVISGNPSPGGPSGPGSSGSGPGNSSSSGGGAPGAVFIGSSAGGSGGGSGPSALAVPLIVASQDLGPLSGLALGHALVLLPLFVVLDVVALIALAGVVRRSWTAQVAD